MEEQDGARVVCCWGSGNCKSRHDDYLGLWSHCVEVKSCRSTTICFAGKKEREEGRRKRKEGMSFLDRRMNLAPGTFFRDQIQWQCIACISSFLCNVRHFEVFLHTTGLHSCGTHIASRDLLSCSVFPVRYSRPDGRSICFSGPGRLAVTHNFVIYEHSWWSRLPKLRQ